MTQLFKNLFGFQISLQFILSCNSGLQTVVCKLLITTE